MNSLVLAYLGDAVYEVYVRKHLIEKGYCKVNILQKESIKYVSALSQNEILNQLISQNFFTEEELYIIKRGRNAKSHGHKNIDIITYKKSTGFESLIGFLFLNNKYRLDELMKEILK